MDVNTLTELAQQDGSVFADLTDAELAMCAEKLQVDEVLAGSTLTREGDFSYRFFVVLDGEVEVLQDFSSVATLGPGQCFGEMGVASDEPRNARVVATERSHVASMIGWDFRDLCEAIPTLGGRIQSIIDARS
ncbi:MAG: cyclic nucleotide-binding domain-containing protein [Actinomycetota bacterium]